VAAGDFELAVFVFVTAAGMITANLRCGLHIADMGRSGAAPVHRWSRRTRGAPIGGWDPSTALGGLRTTSAYVGRV